MKQEKVGNVMRRRMLFSLTLAFGAGLAGCQNSPRTGTMSTQPSMAQSTGWDRSTPVTQTGGTANGTTGLANRSTPFGGSTSTADPNAFPRTSQDAMPRNVGNQTSQYTRDAGLPGDPALAPAGGFQRPATQTGMTSGFATGQPAATPSSTLPPTRPMDPIPSAPNPSSVTAPSPPRPATGLVNDPYPPPPEVSGPRLN
jgi:hypothetical protein